MLESFYITLTISDSVILERISKITPPINNLLLIISPLEERMTLHLNDFRYPGEGDGSGKR